MPTIISDVEEKGGPRNEHKDGQQAEQQKFRAGHARSAIAIAEATSSRPS